MKCLKLAARPLPILEALHVFILQQYLELLAVLYGSSLGGEHVDVGISSGNQVQTWWQLPTFQRNMLPPPSELKMVPLEHYCLSQSPYGVKPRPTLTFCRNFNRFIITSSSSSRQRKKETRYTININNFRLLKSVLSYFKIQDY